jgi:malate dehydrogenase (oxaloacetate-decarboxylating)(NADP+)
MVASMADEPLIFVLANPTPEIMPEEALAAKPNAIIGTGRSDYSNQINNVLGFPFIFRGALDVYASEITETMKMAAAKALAALAHEDVPDSVLSAYGQSSLKFGRDYLIPKPLDPRVLLWVAPAVAQGAIESGVARREIDIEHYKNSLIRRQGAGRMVRSTVLNKAKAGPRMRIVYGEGEQPKVIRAAYQVQEEGIGTPILLGEPDEIHGIIAELGLHFQPKVITPRSEITNYQHYVDKYLELRQRRGVTRAHAGSLVSGRTNFGLMMVLMGDGDAFVSGLTHEYPDILRPALRLFGTRPGVDHASGIYLTIARDRVYVFTDATVNVEPDAATLAEIAVLAADFTRTLGIEPRVAMLSFSNFGGTHHPLAEKVADAVRIVNERRPDIVVDGEMQADTAVVPEIIDERYPFSRVRDANVLVFPDLGSANIAYKLLDRLTEAEAIGPVLLGLGAPVQVIQAGDDVDDIVALSAFAALDSQQRQGIHHVEELESDLILDGR